MKIKVISKVCFQGKLNFISTTTVNFMNECLESGLIIFLDFQNLGNFFGHSLKSKYVGVLVTIFTNLKRSSNKFKGLTENSVRYYDL